MDESVLNHLRTSAVASVATDSGGRLGWRNGGGLGCGGDACVFCWRHLPDWVAREMPLRAAGHFSDGGRDKMVKVKGGMWLFLRVSQHTVLRHARIDSVLGFFIVQETGQLVAAGVVRYGHR